MGGGGRMKGVWGIRGVGGRDEWGGRGGRMKGGMGNQGRRG